MDTRMIELHKMVNDAPYNEVNLPQIYNKRGFRNWLYIKFNMEHYPINMAKMLYAFWQAFNNQPIDDVDVRGIVRLDFMFNECTTFNQNVPHFDTSSCKAMISMFSKCYNFNKPVSFSTASLQYNWDMFTKCYRFNQPFRQRLSGGMYRCHSLKN